MTMICVRSLLLALVFAATPMMMAGETSSPAIEREVARIDRRSADPDQKMLVVEAMARRLGTHRNHLLLLRRRTGESFGWIFVRQLEAEGKSRKRILSELRGVNAELETSTGRRRLAGIEAEPAIRPLVYVETGVDSNSTGTYFTVLPEVGLGATHWQLVAGVPYYRNSGTAFSAGGVGDAYLRALLHGRWAGNDLGVRLVVGFPSGDSNRGLGAGKVTVDGSGVFERDFGWWRPFGRVGVANSVFNSVGYQRPYVSTGNVAYFTGGLDIRLHRQVVAGAGGFAVRPWGAQTVHSRWSMPMPAGGAPMPGGGHPPGGGMPGMGGGIGSLTPVTVQPTTPGPHGMIPPSGVFAAADLRDHGASAWLRYTPRPGITIYVGAARSVPFQLTTVSAGLGFDLGRLLFPGKRL